MSRAARPLALAALLVLLASAACTPAQPPAPSGATSSASRVGAPASASREAAPSSTTRPVDVSAAADAEPGRPGTDDWQVTRQPGAGEVAGYTDPASVVPGQSVTLFVSTTAPRVAATAYRIGAYTSGRGRAVWRSPTLPGVRQPPPEVIDATRTVVAHWKPTLTVRTSGWPPGFYLIKLEASSGGQWQVPLVVRSPSVAGRVALVAPLTTWQAYNDWGGLSLYHGAGGRADFAGRSYAVSFDRPYPAPGAGDFLYSVLPFVSVAERAGVPLAYLANTDLEADPAALQGARGYVSVGHDEYWTPTMRQRVTVARDAGTNLLITGANTMYWRIRLVPGVLTGGPDRLVVGYKDALDPAAAKDPAAATARFNQPPAANPTQPLLGTRYECFPVDAPWTVADATWWGFAGTGVRNGTAFAHLLGVEAGRVYPGDGTPRPLQVLADSSYSCRGTRTSAQAVYYAAASGAGVVNLNSLRWTCALDPGCRDGDMDAATNRFTTRVTTTILRQFARGPVGRALRPVDNLDRFHLPSTRTVYPG
jgi:hypothetical protein